ncbi:hypothetical protein ID866_10389 [Astraeus odoratus]|nr:hypothetical protein ID866_10389 [Astraeus odoratus]
MAPTTDSSLKHSTSYDGEKDTRTPHDFANSANHAKIDDGADMDDDDGDDDDHEPRHGVQKPSHPKLKQDYSGGKIGIPPTPTDSSLGSSVEVGDYGLHRPVAIPAPPMHLHPSSHLPPAATGASLPVSTERHTSTRSSLSANGSAAKLSGDESLLNGYLPSPTSAQSPAYRHNGQPLSNYNSYLGSPSSSLLQSSFDHFPPSSSSSSSSRGGPTPISRGALYNQRSSTYPLPHGHDPQEQMQSMYHQQPSHPLMRHNLVSGIHSQVQPQPPNEMFPTLLDSADAHHHPSHHHQRALPSSQPPQFTALDWPTHGPGTASTAQQSPTQAPRSQQQPHEPTTTGPFLAKFADMISHPRILTYRVPPSTGPPNDPSWLDFLSQNAPAHAAQASGGHPIHLSLPSAEREYAAAERETAIDKYVNGGGVLTSPSSRKRPRTDSLVGGGGGEDMRRHSPPSLGGSNKKEEGH